jgi:hypothetical protein
MPSPIPLVDPVTIAALRFNIMAFHSLLCG